MSSEDREAHVEKISEADLAEMLFATNNVEQAEIALTKAQGAFEFKQNVIASRYQLSPGDNLNLETGEIIRAPRLKK